MEIKTGIYKHYKGREYRVLFVAKGQFSDLHDMEDIVVYETLEMNNVSRYWARPLGDFIGKVEINGASTARFSFIREA
jgi:hypothetical protein